MFKNIGTICTVLLLLITLNVQGQGCVAIRGNTSCGRTGGSLNLQKKEFNLLMGFRHFKSFRHYRGDVEETNRVAEGTEVINISSFLDLSLSYGITDRFYVNAILPVVFHNRSSMYEHGGNPPNGLGERHTTSSKGLADVRLGVGYWLFDPKKHDYNYSLGVGVKLPSGKYNYTDTFYNQGASKDQDLELVVDQSIQPGDGGTGVALDFQGYHPLSHHFGIGTNMFYLINAQATNGVLTRGGKNEFSCPDQYAVRLAAYYNSSLGFSAFLAGRVEGVPSSDLIGISSGFRRPGVAVAIEPGVSYNKNNYSFFASFPIAIYRNRTQSYLDKEKTELTGIFTQGDAAFADYVTSVGFSYRFGGHKNMGSEPMHIDNIIIKN